MPTPPDTPDPAVATAANLAQQFEGFSAVPYQDSGGVWTIGFGSTHDSDGLPVTAKTGPITRNIGLNWLMRDMHQAFDVIASEVKSPLTDNERAAIADFIYNVGAGNFDASTLLRLLNAGDYEGAAAQFAQWTLCDGVVLAGLVRRRAAEAALFKGG